MTLVALTFNYDDKKRIGHVVVSDEIPDDILSECVLAPLLVKIKGEENWKVASFSLIKRVDVDTRPREL